MLALLSLLLAAQLTYTNPILHSDYSDPDVIRVGDDYWMTSSSFNCVPGLQILHSTDLINWEIAGAALPRLCPEECFSSPAHGNGVWAPSIRYHDGLFYIFWGDPDHGIYYVSTDNPRGKWSEPQLSIAGKGLIDPCPLWDEDGKVYLVHGWAGSRAGFKSILTVCELDPESLTSSGENVLVFDGNASGNKTVEGPKLYKRDGWYYIFAPAGGVKEGWQLVLRSRNIYGPYEWRRVLQQGGTSIHGPHQGGWVEDEAGNSWFLHFEDRYAYGRVVHLQPMKWNPDGWCVIGSDEDGDGIGEPLQEHKAPAVKTRTAQKKGVGALSVAPDFSGACIPLNWQWHANPQGYWAMPYPAEGSLRLNCIKNRDGWRNLWDTPNLLLEKITGPEMEFTTCIDFHPSYEGDRTGVVVMGEDYALIGLEYINGKIILTQNICEGASEGAVETVVSTVENVPAHISLRVKIAKGALCTFLYSTDGKKYHQMGKPFTARAGRWIGAKIGYYATARIQKNDGGRVYVK